MTLRSPGGGNGSTHPAYAVGCFAAGVLVLLGVVATLAILFIAPRLDDPPTWEQTTFALKLVVSAFAVGMLGLTAAGYSATVSFNRKVGRRTRPSELVFAAGQVLLFTATPLVFWLPVAHVVIAAFACAAVGVVLMVVGANLDPVRGRKG